MRFAQPYVYIMSICCVPAITCSGCFRMCLHCINTNKRGIATIIVPPSAVTMKHASNPAHSQARIIKATMTSVARSCHDCGRHLICVARVICVHTLQVNGIAITTCTVFTDPCTAKYLTTLRCSERDVLDPL